MTRIEQTQCPYCDAPLNTTDPATEDSLPVPKPGDVCICLNCTKAAILDGEMQLRKPTQLEIVELDADPKFQEAMISIMAGRRLH